MANSVQHVCHNIYSNNTSHNIANIRFGEDIEQNQTLQKII